jgi:4-hydroxybenzoate polyprenyltransferase
MNKIKNTLFTSVEKIINYGHSFELNPLLLIFLIASITFIRTFFENFSNPEPTAGFTPWYTFHGYILFYICVLLSLSLFLAIFLKQKPFFIFKLNVLFFPIIIIAPILDLIISKGSGYCMAYVAHNGTQLFYEFTTFFGPFIGCGISPGIRIEIMFILLGIGLFTFYLKKKVLPTIVAVIFSYLIIFINLSIPGIIVTLFGNFTTAVNPNIFFGEMFSNSLLSSSHTFIPASSFLSGFFENISIFMSRIPWLFSLIFLIFMFYFENKEKTLIFIKDLRVTRIFYYITLSIVGMFIAYKIFGMTSIPYQLPDIFGFIIFFLITALNFTLAVVVNDIEDIKIDEISNPSRPLVQGTFNKSEYKRIAVTLGFFIVSGALLFNYNIFVLTILFQVFYTLYSTHPFFLKKNFITGGLTVALIGIVSILSGFYFLSLDQTFNLIPLLILLPIFLTLFILVNIRDLKDLEGDKVANIKTLPVLFGDKKARFIIGSSLLIMALIMSFLLFKVNLNLSILTLISGFLFFVLITFLKQKETTFFVLMYVFTLLFLFLI